MIYERLVLMRDLLAEDGGIYVHCDWRVNSHIRFVLDEIFGGDYQVNELIWQRSNPHNDTKRYGSIHDTLFVYAKNSNYVFQYSIYPPSEEYIRSHFTQEIKVGVNIHLCP